MKLGLGISHYRFTAVPILASIVESSKYWADSLQQAQREVDPPARPPLLIHQPAALPRRRRRRGRPCLALALQQASQWDVRRPQENRLAAGAAWLAGMQLHPR